MIHKTLCSIILVAVMTGAAAAQDLTGCWMGTVGADAEQRRAALEFRGNRPDWRAAIHVLSRAIDTDSLTSISATGHEVTFAATGEDGSPSFAGRLEGSTLTGERRRTDRTDPFRFERTTGVDTAVGLAGYWNGGLYQGGTLVLRLGLEFVPAPCGQVLVTMDSPDQGTEDLPVTHLAVIGDSLRFEMRYLTGAFRGELAPGWTEATGIWTQGGSLLEMRMSKTDSQPSFDRPQEPKPPFPYETEDVEFVNPADSVTLAGTLTLPPGNGPFPAAVMLTGSGAQNRDEMLMGHKPFLVIADHLTRRGIAVLRYDDRGVGGSTGNVMEATLADNAVDALSAIRLLQAHPRIDERRVGLIGHSEGGWMAPIAATRSDDVAFVVMLAGPAVSGEEIRFAQDSAMALTSGAPQDMIAVNRAVNAAIFRILRAEPDADAAVAAIRGATDSIYASLAPAQQAALDVALASTDSASLDRQWRLVTTRWFRDLMRYDPRSTLDRMTTPVLAVFGELDLQVPASQSVPILERLWADHPDATIRVFPGLNHLFQHAETGLMTEYASIAETFAPEVLELMATWIVERFGPTGGSR